MLIIIMVQFQENDINFQLYTFLYRVAVKSAIVLLPLLGITWAIGIFAVNRVTTVFLWLFNVCNTLQVD